MKQRNIIILVIVVVALAAILIAPGTSVTGLFTGKNTGETNIVRVGNLPVTQGLPLYLAIDKNYFEEAGIKVELTRFEAPNQLIDAMMTGKIDLSETGPSGIVAVSSYRNPDKIRFFSLSGGTISQPNEFLLVPINSNINSIADLNGKKLGIWGGSIQWRTITKELLAKNGLEMGKDVSILELAPAAQVSVFAAGQLDALLALEPIATTIVQKKIGRVIESAPVERHIVDPFYPAIGIVSTDFAEKNPVLTKRIVSILERATKEIQANPNAARQYLKGYTPLDGTILEEVTLPVFVSCRQMTENDLNALQNFFNIFTKNKVIEGEVDATSMLYCN